MKLSRKLNVRKRRVTKSKSLVAKKAVKSLSNKIFAQKVMKVIHRKAENKVWIFYAANQPISCATSTTPTGFSLIPPITQGVGHSQRIGDSVNVVSAKIQGYVNLLPYNATTNPTVGPTFVKIWVLSVKNMQNTGTLNSTTLSSNFFETNNASVGFQGNVLDTVLTVNKQNFTVYATKTILLSSGATQGSTYYNSAGASCGSSGRFSAHFSFDYTKHLKTMKFDDTSPIYPTNRNLWIIFQAVYADGTSLALTPAEYHCNYRVEYEDL